MSELDSFVRDVEQAIAGGDPERRTRSLRKLTELFVEHASHLNDAHVSIFDEVLIRLARQSDALARRDLSASLADLQNAPSNMVRDLAYDDNAAVAKPVLERSARLSDDDLMEIAAHKEQEHLLAISRRHALSERITETLVDRGDDQVVRAVAENGGAKLSRKGLAVLAKKAEGSVDLLEALQKRADVPPEVRRMWMGSKQAEKTGQQPKGAAEADMERIEAALGGLAASIAGGARPSHDISAALKQMTKLSRGKPIDEVRVAAWIKGKRTEDALAAIAHNARLPAVAVVSAYEAAAYEPFLLAVRAARLSWNTFKMMLNQKTGAPPPADVVKTSFEIFQQVPVELAQELAGRICGDEATVEGAAA
jgi:uncharacterized protein (DUF2336 family)